MLPTLKTPPTEEPVSPDEFCAHLLLDDSLAKAQGTDIAAKLLSARIDCEAELGRPLITSTWVLTLGSWPCDNYIELLGNTQSITSLKYTDCEGVTTTVSTDEYKLVHAYNPSTDGITDARTGLLMLRYGKYWPAVTLDTGEPIEIVFVAGWKDAASVPQPIKTWIEMRAATLYRNREDATTGQQEAKPFPMPSNVLPYKVWKF